MSAELHYWVKIYVYVIVLYYCCTPKVDPQDLPDRNPSSTGSDVLHQVCPPDAKEEGWAACTIFGGHCIEWDASRKSR